MSSNSVADFGLERATCGVSPMSQLQIVSGTLVGGPSLAPDGTQLAWSKPQTANLLIADR